MKERRAQTLLCPIRNGDCYGEMCMAWVISWENNNEGCCGAFRPSYEQEIGEGWKKYGRRIMDSRKKLFARLKLAERERDEAREEMKEAAGELLIPLPQSDPTVRKLLLANSIMRQERDAARAELEQIKKETAPNG